MATLVVSPTYGQESGDIEAGIQSDTRKKRLKQRSLMRQRQSIASTPNVLGGGVRGQTGMEASKKGSVLTSINSMPSLLGDM